VINHTLVWVFFKNVGTVLESIHILRPSLDTFDKSSVVFNKFNDLLISILALSLLINFDFMPKSKLAELLTGVVVLEFFRT
jgi:hypothetical protein